MDIFGEEVISKAQLLRASIVYGKLLPGQLGKSEHVSKIDQEISTYRAASGGRWNYDDLCHCLIEITRGGSVEQALEYFSGLRGHGEAASKISIFKEVIGKTPIIDGQSAEVGARRVELGDRVVLPISYDAGFVYEGVVYCIFIHPRSEPLKWAAKAALAAEFSAPFEGMTCAHKLIFVENPKIGGRRASSVDIIDFGYHTKDQDFREHLRLSRLRMGSD